MTPAGGFRVLLRNVQRFRGGLVFKAHRLWVSLNSRLERNTEEEKRRLRVQGSTTSAPKKKNLLQTLQYGEWGVWAHPIDAECEELPPLIRRMADYSQVEATPIQGDAKTPQGVLVRGHAGRVIKNLLGRVRRRAHPIDDEGEELLPLVRGARHHLRRECWVRVRAAALVCGGWGSGLRPPSVGSKYVREGKGERGREREREGESARESEKQRARETSETRREGVRRNDGASFT